MASAATGNNESKHDDALVDKSEEEESYPPQELEPDLLEHRKYDNIPEDPLPSYTDLSVHRRLCYT
jgi:hypothetical protein